MLNVVHINVMQTVFLGWIIVTGCGEGLWSFSSMFCERVDLIGSTPHGLWPACVAALSAAGGAGGAVEREM